MRIALACFILLLIANPVVSQDVEIVLSQKLKKNHPRLLLTPDRLAKLKSATDSDSILNRYVNDVLFKADNLTGTRPVKYHLEGTRLIEVSRDVKERTLFLGLAYRWTGNEKYADELLQVILTACEFPDWNPSHFLDVAEMTFAVAIAYDWLYNYLDEESKSTIEESLLTHGLQPGLKAYQSPEVDYGWWKDVTHNWNLVCNGGLMVGGLALANIYPDISKKIISQAIYYLPLALNEYNPDGAWAEGPGYWNYATLYTAYALGSLQTSCDYTFDLTKINGLAETGYFPIYTVGPTALFVNFADSRFKKARTPMPVMQWLAKTYNTTYFSQDEHEVLQQYNAEPEHVIWYTPPQKTLAELPTNKFFESEVQLLSLRESWNDSATFVGVKAGFNEVNHGHLDLGNFEMDALGKRWAIDLGSDDYNLTGYWDRKPNGERWNIYRLGSASHNVITVNKKNQNVKAESYFTAYNLTEDEPYGIIELSETYPVLASSIKRGVKLVNNNQVLIQDEVVLNDTASVQWGITTEASINIEGAMAELSIGDKKLHAYLISPAKATFVTESAVQPDPQQTNRGIQRLIVQLNGIKTETITVLFAPVDDTKDYKLSDKKEHLLIPLSEW